MDEHFRRWISLLQSIILSIVYDIGNNKVTKRRLLSLAEDLQSVAKNVIEYAEKCE